MCPEQCLLPFLAWQYVIQELALSALVAGPQTLLCCSRGDFCLHYHTGVWLGSKTGNLNAEMSRCCETGPSLREGHCWVTLHTGTCTGGARAPSLLEPQSNVFEVHGKGQMPQKGFRYWGGICVPLQQVACMSLLVARLCLLWASPSS